MLSSLVFLVGAPIDQASLSRFSAWTHEHNKTYASHGARELGLRTFLANEAVIAELQAAEQGSAVYGHTRFSDLSSAQVAAWSELTTVTCFQSLQPRHGCGITAISRSGAA
eukprot:4677053-Prymnesium_polylepis.1